MRGKPGNRQRGRTKSNSNIRGKNPTLKGTSGLSRSQGFKYGPSQTNSTQSTTLNERNISDNGKRKLTVPTSNLKEDATSSDSEPDALSSLVSSFAKSKKHNLILSDEDSSTDEESSPEEVEQIFKSDNELDYSESEEDDEVLSDYDFEQDVPSFDENTKFSAEDPDDTSLEVDPFERHIQYDLGDDLYEAASSVPPRTETHLKQWPVLGQLKFSIPSCPEVENPAKKLKRIDDDVSYAKPGEVPSKLEQFSDQDWSKVGVKSQIQGNIYKANCKLVDSSLHESDQLTPLQKELFSIVNNYQDLFYPERTLDNGEEVRFVYCLHVINHVLKTRLKVTHHNARLASRENPKDEVPDEFRDQGLIRPKVLLLVPFRNSALRVLEMLISILLEENDSNVINKKRFYEEFSSGEIAMPKKNPKPEDYEKTFAGDTDDNFKVGISLTKKSLKLYVDFYSADIIIASPLGIRMIIGAEGQAERDYDFLASMELLVLDQAEIILMQNWDHLLHVWNHLHMQPKESHGTNFARVRPWALNGRAHLYRQTLVFSANNLPQISALFSKKCNNYAGKVQVTNPVKNGTICQIILQLPQVFNRIDCVSAVESIDARFNHLVCKILPQFKESVMKNTLIYVPSYFDYVRIRNYFKKETISFTQICEYTKEGKVARARDMFFHSTCHFLLYSERFHFFRRIRLRGIKHIIFYQPPTIPHFYSELCNLMQASKEAEEGALSVSVMYTRYDAAQLAAIVGSERVARMLATDRPVHMFMTGE